MTEPSQSKLPEENTIDHRRRSLLKTLIGGAAGLAFTTALTSPAFAKRRRRTGQSQTKGQPKPQSQGKGKRHNHL